MDEMFCFQCQQTAGNSGCVKVGVCGKQPETAHLQDELVCRLIRLAQVCREKPEREVTRLLADGLFTTLTNVNFDNSGGVRYSYGQHRPPCFERTFHDYHQCQLQYKNCK